MYTNNNNKTLNRIIKLLIKINVLYYDAIKLSQTNSPKPILSHKITI